MKEIPPTTGNPNYRRFIEEERARKLWEQKPPKENRQTLLTILAGLGLVMGLFNSYLILRESVIRYETDGYQLDVDKWQDIRMKTLNDYLDNLNNRTAGQ